MILADLYPAASGPAVIAAWSLAFACAALAMALAMWRGTSWRRARRMKRAEAESVLRETLERTQAQLLASSRVSQMEALAAGDVNTVVQEISELAARTTGCARINAWLFNEDESELHCIDLFDAKTSLHTAGMVLREPEFRAEFAVLKHSRYVDADDPLTDPRTAGYIEPYLKPLGITSMLDAVVRVAGHNLGLLCFEHVGRAHHWEGDEIAFACQMADKIGLTIVTSRRLESERRLRESESALAEAQSIAHLGNWELDVASAALTWSDETYRIFGLTRDTFTPTYEGVLSRIHPDDRAMVDRTYRSSLLQRDLSVDHRIVLNDGTVRHVAEHARTFTDATGRAIRSVGTVQDITNRKTGEEQLHLANTILRTQMETSPDAILVVDATGRILSFNQRFIELWSVPRELAEAGEDGPLLAAVVAQIADSSAFVTRVQHLYAHPDEAGHDEIELRDGRIVDRLTAPLRAGSEASLGRVWFFRDVTDRKRVEARIRHTARHDGLTGLVNRLVFKEAIDQAIARARRGAKAFAVLYLDLDRFKDINDSLGHAAGDELLVQVGARLRAACRTTDTVARFGGDEFAVIASDACSPADAAALATTLIDALSRPFQLAAGEIRTGASIGIAMFAAADAATDPEMLLSQADVALYRAKEDGRGLLAFFTEALDKEVRTRVALTSQLREAIACNQLVLHYQPQVQLATGRIIGVEALVRWRHPDRGLIEPSAFVPIAEHSGLIGALSMWVLRESCRQAKAWRDAGFDLGTIAVNLSALQFKAPQLLEHSVLTIVAESGLPATCLELELTETALMAASREPSHILTRLRERGVRLAIDDFGTGYSSLDYLQRFPVDRIKIAREFVAQAVTAGSATIIRATIGLARELGIAVIAEGVESTTQRDLLRAWGCEHAQGFLFSPPLSAEALLPLLQHGTIPLSTNNLSPDPEDPTTVGVLVH
jgi:diguanylate cyclase (GGDEF)-like protein/PAS domain S-box-containing protein